MAQALRLRGRAPQTPAPFPTAPGSSPAGDPVVPYHTIAFSQQKLRAAIRRAAGQDPAFSYGFVIHSRRYSARPDSRPHHPER